MSIIGGETTGVEVDAPTPSCRRWRRSCRSTRTLPSTGNDTPGLHPAASAQVAEGFLHPMQVSTDARCAVQGVPGFVPRVLRDAEVGLFRAEDRVFDAVIDGWKPQMMARGLATQTIEGRCRVLRRFQEYAGTFPFQPAEQAQDGFQHSSGSARDPARVDQTRASADHRRRPRLPPIHDRAPRHRVGEHLR